MDEQHADTQSWRTIAALIHNHLDELALLSRDRYRRDYAHSNNSRLPDEAALRWCEECFLSLARELECGVPDAHLYETIGGDMVVQRESMAYQIDAYLEETLFVSRFIAELICRELAGSVSLINELLASFESFVQWRIRANLASFSEMVSQPQALAPVWRLDARRNASEGENASDSRRGSATDDRAAKDALDARLAELTPREYDIARMASEGKTNAQIASSCNVKLSTVKNTLSRVYAKLHVTNRVEMTLVFKSNAE